MTFDEAQQLIQKNIETGFVDSRTHEHSCSKLVAYFNGHAEDQNVLKQALVQAVDAGKWVTPEQVENAAYLIVNLGSSDALQKLIAKASALESISGDLVAVVIAAIRSFPEEEIDKDLFLPFLLRWLRVESVASLAFEALSDIVPHEAGAYLAALACYHRDRPEVIRKALTHLYYRGGDTRQGMKSVSSVAESFAVLVRTIQEHPFLPEDFKHDVSQVVLIHENRRLPKVQGLEAKFLSLPPPSKTEGSEAMQEASQMFVFDSFRIDTEKKLLWRGEEQLALRPRAVAVLVALAERAGEVVTKEELFKRVWAETPVTATVLYVCIREIRQALADSTQTPRFIQTVGRRGYRFIGNTSGEKPFPSSLGEVATTKPIVGRAREIAWLQQWFRHVERGERQVVFVTGEPGIGKTTVVDLFLDRVRATGLIRIGRGHCLGHYGKGEAYLPILETLVRLSREPGGARLLAVLSRYAPTWLMQMPALLSNEEFAQLQSRAQGVTPQRMLREMADALDVLTTERPLILVLEDLHWSDDSTVALITALAQRQERARLMVIGTYRPSDLASEHPLQVLKQELQLHNRWQELPLNLLTEQDVTTYVTGQLPERPVPEKLAHAIYRRTEGNPLFMVNLVTALTEQDAHGTGTGRHSDSLNSQKLGIPENLQQTIAQRVARLDPNERSILEAASVAGIEFTAVVIAAAVRKNPIEVEERFGELARRKQFIQVQGTVEWPDGTVTKRYGFIHALYQEALYGRVTGGKRIELHQRIGECIEQGYSNRRQDVATELARHFEQGRDFHRTVQYLGYAAEGATQRCAYPEAIRHLTRALEWLKAVPESPERAQGELLLQQI